MSGGYFNYRQYNINDIADAIDELIANSFAIDKELDQYGDKKWREYPPEIIERFREAVNYLRLASIYTHRIDWLVSCDDSEDSFHKRLQTELEALKTKNSSFSDFIRNASREEKDRVYKKVMDEATAAQELTLKGETIMNPHIELVKKWLADPESVTQQELQRNYEIAYADAAKTSRAYYASRDAMWAAAEADASDAENAKYYVAEYERSMEKTK
jgi:hypothetical protein